MMNVPDKDESRYFDTKFGKFYIGQAVIYSVYPLVKDGFGMVTKEGVLTVGQTYMDVIKNKDGSETFSDICRWDDCYEVISR